MLLCACAPYIAASLCHIFNKSVSLGEFPTGWKVSNTVPIPKAGPTKTVTNYRPYRCCLLFQKYSNAVYITGWSNMSLLIYTISSLVSWEENPPPLSSYKSCMISGKNEAIIIAAIYMRVLLLIYAENSQNFEFVTDLRSYLGFLATIRDHTQTRLVHKQIQAAKHAFPGALSDISSMRSCLHSYLALN